MGNTGSSSGRGQQEESVDLGYLSPQGVYTGIQDWNHAIVAQLIVDRKLAPFYRPLEDYDESWDDEQMLAHRKELPDSDSVQTESSSRTDSAASTVTHSRMGHHKRPSGMKEGQRFSEGAIYRGAVECPICFLYYPPNINYSRCCEQAMCTECFVQIKRAEPTPTHLVSEPAACPYCMQENFGVVYTPPSWRSGIGSEGSTPPSWPDSPGGTTPPLTPNPAVAMKRRRRSFGPDSPEVVTTDQIRPDWEAKLAAVRAAVARRANRRIIMRQVGDRLIPVGITSGRVHALPAEGEQGEGVESGGGGGNRRSRRRQQNQEFNQFLGSIPLGGQDLEELMVMEAMRLSLLEHEDQQRREQQTRNQNEGDSGTQSAPSAPVLTPGSRAVPEAPPTSLAPSPSNLPLTPTSPSQTQDRGRSVSPIVSGARTTPVSSKSSPESTASTRDGNDPSTTQVVRSTTPRPSESAMLDAVLNAGSTVSNESHESIPESEERSLPPLPNGSADATDSTDSLAVAPSMPHTLSFASSVVSGETSGRAGSYDVLLSSPDETDSTAEQPLLPSTAITSAEELNNSHA